jgi:hypothetical protein
MQYLRWANGAERFVLSLHELRQHERLFLEGTAPNPICRCRLSRKVSFVVGHWGALTPVLAKQSKPNWRYARIARDPKGKPGVVSV